MSSPDLITLVFRKDLEALKAALDAGANPNMQDRDRRTALIHAAIDGPAEFVEELIGRGTNLDHQDVYGKTALHYAVSHTGLEIATLLLQGGAAVDPQDRNGNTPLFDAVFNARGNGEVVDLLVAHGADKRKENFHGVSPLSLDSNIANYPSVLKP